LNELVAAHWQLITDNSELQTATIRSTRADIFQNRNSGKPHQRVKCGPWNSAVVCCGLAILTAEQRA
jgi:hypothetical protein